MTSRSASPEQLTLLPPSTVPVQFRLDEATRRRGLRHIAEIRAQLERLRPVGARAAPANARSASAVPAGRGSDRAA